MTAGGRPVIVGFDAGPSGADALALGRRLRAVLGCRLVVAVVRPAAAAISPARVDAEWVADRHRVATQMLDGARRLLNGVDPDLPVDYRVVASSSAAHGLHDLADEVGAAAIVVGSRTEAPHARLFAGSTAERLLAGSSCPVAVAPSGLRGWPSGGVTRIGVAYIDTAEARAALEFAAGVAARVRAHLHLYTVVADQAEVWPAGVGRDAERAFLNTARDEYQRALDSAVAGLPEGVHATTHLRTGHAVDVLSDLGPDEIDILCCGSRGYGPVRRVMLGGVSSRLVRRARTPLIVVPRA
ncbi:universal stress protein [Virgisporangium aliadipatigenens]|uniref:universal stress protein n=1 Tax=Virgisporangium aliadipatigenens TaxID=741659 RepID=UPI0019443A1F|nr:universal stress protein [Virgisporangium aliadipatigenens]